MNEQEREKWYRYENQKYGIPIEFLKRDFEDELSGKSPWTNPWRSPTRWRWSTNTATAGSPGFFGRYGKIKKFTGPMSAMRQGLLPSQGPLFFMLPAYRMGAFNRHRGDQDLYRPVSLHQRLYQKSSLYLCLCPIGRHGFSAHGQYGSGRRGPDQGRDQGQGRIPGRTAGDHYGFLF